MGFSLKGFFQKAFFLKGRKLNLLVFFFPLALLANPHGAEVKSGALSFSSSENTLSINQTSDRAIINWQEFSIKEGERAEFNLPSKAASTLNRVTGGNISEIYGQLKSSGQLYLINPNGIVIGPSGRIDVAGFLASTYALSDSDYLSGEKLLFQEV
ncbi:MAG: filamentous hemagglutinin N-terminal domain-containing protein, partial [Parachlamydiales bacterium]